MKNTNLIRKCQLCQSRFTASYYRYSLSVLSIIIHIRKTFRRLFEQDDSLSRWRKYEANFTSAGLSERKRLVLFFFWRLRIKNFLMRATDFTLGIFDGFFYLARKLYAFDNAWYRYMIYFISFVFFTVTIIVLNEYMRYPLTCHLIS